ncbi:hypothetical protein BH11BAC1_BH11BAC1_02880 [soil metagenome]
MIQHKKDKNNKMPLDFPVPAGTEQETGFTRAETEKIKEPIRLELNSKNKKRRTLKK